MKLLFTEKHIVRMNLSLSLLSTENSDACLKQTLDKGKSVCMKGCICFEQSLSCTDLCPCQADDLCRNENTHLVISRNTNKDDDI
jgi:hypothetical protein